VSPSAAVAPMAGMAVELLLGRLPQVCPAVLGRAAEPNGHRQRCRESDGADGKCGTVYIISEQRFTAPCMERTKTILHFGVLVGEGLRWSTASGPSRQGILDRRFDKVAHQPKRHDRYQADK